MADVAAKWFTENARLAAAATEPNRRQLPVAAMADLLGVSKWTAKRMYDKGELPLVCRQGRWFGPISFLDHLFASMGPGRAPEVAEIAAEWFAANEAADETASRSRVELSAECGGGYIGSLPAAVAAPLMPAVIVVSFLGTPSDLVPSALATRLGE